jgi:hypothetical protein
MNNQGLKNENLNEFFNETIAFNFINKNDHKNNLLQAKSYNDILKSLYGKYVF